MKNNLLKGVVLLSAMSVICSCGVGKKTSEEQTSDSTAVTQSGKVLVKTSVVKLEDVDQIAQFSSNIDAYMKNNIMGMQGRIEKILVKVGDRVRTGQLLVVMDQSSLAQMSIQIATLEADYNRMKNVYEAGGISKQQIDQIEAQLKAQKISMQTVKTNTELRSPIDGVVTARNFDPGDMATMPILQVMQIHTLKVLMDLSEQYFPTVKIGQPVEIVADIYPDKVFNGKVSLIYPSINPATRTFTIEVTIPNGGSTLRPGMFSRSTIKLGVMPSIMVEDLAVQKQVGTNEKFVYVIEGGVAKRRTVTTGRQIGSKINILAGLVDGEEVAIAGLSRLEDGKAVEVRNN